MTGARHPEGPLEFEAGDTVGPYRIESQLGAGGIAHVYRAVGPGGRAVALKLVKPSFSEDLVWRRRFDRERRVAARVDHPHVVAVLDAGEHEGVPYLVQELIRGGSLLQRLERERPLPLELTVTLCLQVAAGLDAMHELRLVHRDLKPSKILLDEDHTAYISDFGLAKDRDGSLLTRPGQAIGSMDYMAPEQIRGEEVSAATDVYALGCVMCECISGVPPFADRRGMRVLWAHLQDDPPDPCAGRRDVPEDLTPAITRALAKESHKRPASATAYARMVQVAAGTARLSRGNER